MFTRRKVGHSRRKSKNASNKNYFGFSSTFNIYVVLAVNDFQSILLKILIYYF
jgi:hypothetical protein